MKVWGGVTMLVVIRTLMVFQGLYAVIRIVRLHLQGDWPYRWRSTTDEGRSWLVHWQAVYRTVYGFYAVLLGQTLVWLALLQAPRPIHLDLFLILSLGLFVGAFIGLSRHVQHLVSQVFSIRPFPPPSFGLLYRFLIHPPVVQR